jgi:hypothetical protein
VKKKTGPAAADLADKAALTGAEKEAEVIVLGYFTEAKVGGWGPRHALGLARGDRGWQSGLLHMHIIYAATTPVSTGLVPCPLLALLVGPVRLDGTVH